MRLTKRIVDGAHADSTGKQRFIWDDEIRGFGLCIKPSGAKSYVLQYRNAAGQSRRMVIGKHGTLTPDQARQIAADKAHDIRKGRDPLAEKRSVRDSMTVSELMDWYLEEGGSRRLLGRRNLPIKPSTLAMDRSRIDTHVKPLIGTRPVLSLNSSDIRDLQATILKGRPSSPRTGRGGVISGGAGVAGRTVSMLRAIFGHAVAHGLLQENPAQGVKRVADQERTRRLSLTDLECLGRSLNSIRLTSPVAVAAIEFILLTGWRKSEALNLKLGHIDQSTARARLPDTKSGPAVRVLNRRALKVVESLSRPPGVEWAFPSAEHGKHIVNIGAVLGRATEQAELSEVTPHVLRHTYASIAAECGCSELVIAGLLGHSARGVTAGYVHDPGLAGWAETVAEKIYAYLHVKSQAKDVGNEH